MGPEAWDTPRDRGSKARGRRGCGAAGSRVRGRRKRWWGPRVGVRATEGRWGSVAFQRGGVGHQGPELGAAGFKRRRDPQRRREGHWGTLGSVSRGPRDVGGGRGPGAKGPGWGGVGVGTQVGGRARASLPALRLGPAGGDGRPQQRGVPRSGPRARSRSGSGSGARSGPRSGSRAAGAGLDMFGRRAGLASPPRPLWGPRTLCRQRRPAGGGGLRAAVRRRERDAGRARRTRHSAGWGRSSPERRARRFATAGGAARRLLRFAASPRPSPGTSGTRGGGVARGQGRGQAAPTLLSGRSLGFPPELARRRHGDAWPVGLAPPCGRVCDVTVSPPDVTVGGVEGVV